MTTAYSGDGITFPDNSVQATAPRVGMVNRIINGDMRIDQRNGGGVSSALNGYFIDRWSGFRGAGTITPVFSGQQVSDAPTGFINSAKITVTTAGTGAYYSLLRQHIEGLNVSDLGFGTASAKTVTLSFWVKSSITGVYAAGIQNPTGARTYVSNYTISSANTWEQKTITIAGDTTGTWATDNSSGILVNFDLGTSTGTVATPNTWGNVGIFTSSSIKWSSTNGATFYVTGVQLEKGSTATDFEYVDYGRQLQMCQRYYQDFANGIGVGLMATKYTPNAGHWITVGFNPRLRAAPTITTNTWAVSQPVVYGADAVVVSLYNASSIFHSQSTTVFNASSEL